MPDEVDLRSLFEEYERTAAVNVLEKGNHKLKITGCTPRGKGLFPVYTPAEGPGVGTRVLAGGIYPGDSEGGRIAFFRKLEKFGLGKEFFNQRPSLADVAKAMIGRVVIIELDVGEWQGDPRNEMGFNIQLVEAPPLPPVGGVPTATPVETTPVTETPLSTPVSEATPVPVQTPAPTPADDDPGF